MHCVLELKKFVDNVVCNDTFSVILRIYFLQYIYI